MAAAKAAKKPSDAAIQRLFGKVGGSLEQALTQSTLNWYSKSLDDEDAKVVAYVVAASAPLKELYLGGACAPTAPPRARRPPAAHARA